MNNTTYIQEDTTENIVQHLRELSELDNTKRNMLDFEEHLKELLHRHSYSKLVSRAFVLKSLNTVDKSSDDTLTIIDASTFIKELFKKEET
jgi:hypothetical protein